jgi:hypothetical protein
VRFRDVGRSRVPSCGPRLADAEKPAPQLFVKSSREWFPELYGGKNILRGRIDPQSRGFPGSLYAEADNRLDVGQWAMKLAPVTEVEFRDTSDSATRRLVQCRGCAASVC